MEKTIEIVQSTFEVAKPIAQQVVDHFYVTLFQDYPQAKPLFSKTEMSKQKKALIGSLVFIVDNLTHMDKLKPYLEKMGRRHVQYGTRPEHYPWVGRTLLKTLEHFFGEKFTPEVREAWTQAVTLIAETMIAGAEQVQAEIDESLEKLVRERARKLLLAAVDEVCSTNEIKDELKKRVRSLLIKAIDSESQFNGKKAA